MRKITLLLAGILLFSQALAAPNATKTANTDTPTEKLLSDAWYTVTVAGPQGKSHYGYYNDHVSIRGGKLFFQNRYWKKEEDFINEEQVGAYAQDNAELAPLFFNFHSTYRSTELTVDGSVENRRMTVKVRKGQQDLPIVKKDIPQKAFFEVFFPVWLNRHESQLSAGKSVSFMTVFENAVDDGFSTVAGRVRLEKPDEFAQKTGSRKFTVELKDMKSLWWFDGKGVPLRIEMPQQNTVVERVTPEAAKAFLSGN